MKQYYLLMIDSQRGYSDKILRCTFRAAFKHIKFKFNKIAVNELWGKIKLRIRLPIGGSNRD